jgi:hypothetical protein
MSKSLKLTIILGFLGVMIYVVISSFGLAQASCEVCMEFKGRESCRTARGVSREEAMQTARDNACARITNGRAESIRCGNSEPKSVRCSD